jgi:hypothetical protein
MRLCVLVIVAPLALVGCGSDPPEERDSTGTAAAITVPLHEENHSGHHGEATLEPSEASASVPGGAKREGIRVTITLGPDASGSNPAHIHDVTCVEYDVIACGDIPRR